MREVFGEYRGPTGVGAAPAAPAPAASPRWRRGCGRCRAGHPSCSSPSPASTATPTAPSRSPSPPATPGWRSSTRASASPPSRSPPSARDEDPDVIGLSILSGSHLELVPDVMRPSAAPSGVDAPVVVGGIIPEEDRPTLAAAGVAAVYTPKDFDVARIMREIAELATAHRG